MPVRPRHDGWTPVRQVEVVRAIAETANIEEACRRVGMSPQSSYTLRSRADAGSFRRAIDLALDHGACRLEERMLARAMDGVATPIFYKGEQIGERRRYDERLAMFILRARLPDRYGKWRDNVHQVRGDPDGAAKMLHDALRRLVQDVCADAAGMPRTSQPPVKRDYVMDNPADEAAYQAAQDAQERALLEAAEAAELAEEKAEEVAWQAELARAAAARDARACTQADSRDDVAPVSLNFRVRPSRSGTGRQRVHPRC